MATINRLPQDWTEYDFVKTLTKSDLGKKYQINSSEILPEGKYPVIDQGQRYIAGYSNDAGKVYSPQQPLIIFGDHTRCFKFVNFPFIVGADGTKVLFPDAALFNPKYYYFYLLSLRIPNRGYNRHFKILKEQKILRPPTLEQNNITNVLTKIQSDIEIHRQIVKTTMELKKSLMQKLLTKGLRGEKQKKSEIGFVPCSWDIIKLKQLVDFRTGKLNSNQAKKDGEYPFFTCSQETFWIDKYAFDIEAILLSGNNARAIYSVKYYKGKFNAYQRTYVITLKDASQNSYLFLKHILSFYLERLRILSIGTSTKYLTLGILENLEVIRPLKQEQEQIACILEIIDRKIENSQAKLSLLQSLFQSTLQQLMTGQIRVKDLSL